jgi:glycosyltransferase involved in cell wall biosynthesis
MDTKIASLCVLAYERPDHLERLIGSLHKVDAGYPYELIIHNDGSGDHKVRDYLHWLGGRKLASIIIENCGQNMGVAKSLKRCIGSSSGDYIFKLDSDLEFIEKDWLKKSVDLLDDETVLCLLDYRNYDPDDKRFDNIHDKGGYFISDNFVSSAYGFTKATFDKFGHEMGDDGWHKFLHRQGHRLLITKPDYVRNTGFGIDSVWVGATLHEEPLIFKNENT